MPGSSASVKNQLLKINHFLHGEKTNVDNVEVLHGSILNTSTINID